MAYIHQISVSNPQSALAQNDIAGFMGTAMKLNEENERKLKAVFRLSGIKSRYSVLSDYAFKDPKDWTFYSKEGLANTGDRMGVYQKEALPLVEKALNPILEKHEPSSFTHLITVSCTGMFAPGLDIQMVKKWGMRPNIERTSIQFMGCFAAINALKTANHICRSNPDANVLIVCIELCTLHFQSEFNEDNLLANTLFGDGAACVVVNSESINSLYSIDGFESVIDDNSEEEMAWNIGNTGFEMKLTSYVPNIIQEKIRKLTDLLMVRFGKQLSDIKHFAIHPGGKRILEAVEKGLGLTKEQNKAAYEVLGKYGNMSSPTVLFVLNKLQAEVKKGDQVLSFAFGPGLTMESMLLKGNA